MEKEVLLSHKLQDHTYEYGALNLRWHSANIVVVLSRFFMRVKFFPYNFYITLVKNIVTLTNVFSLFQALLVGILAHQ